MWPMPQLPEKVRAARQAKGLTIEALAFAAGLSVRSVSRAEAGEHEPSLRSLAALAAALDISPADLLSDDARPVPVPSGEGPEQ